MTISKRAAILFLALALLLAVAGVALVLVVSNKVTGVAESSPCANPAESVPCTAPDGSWISVAGMPSPSTHSPSTTYSPPAYVPTKDDFAVTVRVTEKRCFGSAGCNVGYQIEPEYNGPPMGPSADYTVTYEVTGGESGPTIGSISVEGDTMTFQETGFLQTPSSSTEITAVVTDVF